MKFFYSYLTTTPLVISTLLLPTSNEDLLRGLKSGLELCLEETRALNELPAVAASRERIELALEGQYEKCPGMEGRHRWGWTQCDGPCGGGHQHRWGQEGCGGHCTGHGHSSSTNGDDDGAGGGQGECDGVFHRWGWGKCDVVVWNEYLDEFAEDCREAGGEYQVMDKFVVECADQMEGCHGEGWQGCLWVNNSQTCTGDDRCHWNETEGSCTARPCRSFGTNFSTCEQQRRCTWGRRQSHLGQQNLPVCIAQSCLPEDFTAELEQRVEEVWRDDLQVNGDVVTCDASYGSLITNDFAEAFSLAFTFLATCITFLFLM